MNSLFGILVLERDPPSWEHFWGYLQSWLQDAGGFAVVGLTLWVVHRLTSGQRTSPDEPRIPRWVLIFGSLALLLYAAAGVVMATVGVGEREVLGAPPEFRTWTFDLLLMAAGATAIVAALGPFVADAVSMSGRRIWAIARLTFKEAIRNRVLLFCFVPLLIFLFPASWFRDIKPEDELRTDISVVYFVLTAFLLLIAMALVSFSIPTDVRRQTIHTIVTKPVQRFEIVLGRFLGFVGLMSLILIVLTVASLVVISTSSIDPLAKAESMRARKPVYGQMGFFSTMSPDFRGVSVGREWEYRKYIAGASGQNAVWSFRDLPSSLATREDGVPVEFEFDIFRTTKGQENVGVSITITAVTHNAADQTRIARDGVKASEAYDDEAAAARINPANARPEDGASWEFANELSRKYGFHQVRGVQVTDYHSFSIVLPPGLFENALEGDPGDAADGQPLPRLRLFVTCQTRSQYLGVAKNDLYILESDGRFSVNFFKGVVGIWALLCLVSGVAVAVSTYLSGVVSFVVTLIILIGGYFREFIFRMSQNLSPSGGPFQSLKKLTGTDSAPGMQDPTPAQSVMMAFDQSFSWTLRRVFNVIPDVEQLSFGNYVAEGFNVSAGLILINLLILTCYLLPWGLFAYYLMRSREIATW